MKKPNMKIENGDKVLFDTEKLDVFKSETTGDTEGIKQYQKLVLAGINQVGVVKEYGVNLTTVSFPDGWDLPIPTKYLIVLPKFN